MNKLLKILATAVGFSVMAILSVGCEADVDNNELEISLPGKVFVNSYFEEGEDYHEAGTEVLEFRSDDSIYKHTMFCFLAGNYLQLFDDVEKGRYNLFGDYLSVDMDTMETVAIQQEGENIVIRCPVHGKYELSDLSVEGIKTQFQRVHKHSNVTSAVVPGDSVFTVSSDERYIGCLNRRSFVFTVDTVTGSHSTNDQLVKLRITNVPGSLEISEANGNIYLMKFGSMTYVPVDKEMALSSPEDIVLQLVCDGSTPDFTLVSASEIKDISGAAKAYFGKLNKKLY